MRGTSWLFMRKRAHNADGRSPLARRTMARGGDRRSDSWTRSHTYRCGTAPASHRTFPVLLRDEYAVVGSRPGDLRAQSYSGTLELRFERRVFTARCDPSTEH